MGVIEGFSCRNKDRVISVPRSELIRPTRYIQDIRVVVEIDEKGERASLSDAVVDVESIGGVVVEPQPCTTIGQHPGHKVDYRQRNSPLAHVVNDTVVDGVGKSTFNVEKEHRSNLALAPGVFDVMDKVMHGISSCVARASTEMGRREKGEAFRDVGELSSNKGRQQLGDGAKEGDRAERLREVISSSPKLPQYNRQELPPRFIICSKREDGAEYEVEVVDDDIHTFREDNVRDAVGAWRLVWTQLRSLSPDLFP